MCGRYNIVPDAEALFLAYQILNDLYGDPTPRYNIAPSQIVPIVIETDAGRTLAPAKWGLVPFWSKEPKSQYSTMNAKAESVRKSPAFRAAFKRSRCIIPASGFYEWHATAIGKQPFNITSAEAGHYLSMAGIYDSWHQGEADELVSCSIITTSANQVMQPIHNRMPVLLSSDDFEVWLKTPADQTDALQGLLKPCPSEWLRTYPVSRAVNNPRHDGPELLDEIEP